MRGQVNVLASRGLCVFCLGVIGIGFAYLNTGCSSKAPEPQQEPLAAVPNIKGQTLQNALGAISAAQLTVGEVQQRASTEPPYTVVDQRPGAGAQIALGSKVNLVIAEQPEKASVTIPNLGGLSKDEALSVIAGLGLQIAQDQYQRWQQKRQQTRATRGAGLVEVIKQEPPPGSVVTRGSTVRLFLTDEAESR